MLKNLFKAIRFYLDSYDCINPSSPPLKIKGGRVGLRRLAGLVKGYKVSLEKLSQHICLIN
jgi:hypothetical protein